MHYDATLFWFRRDLRVDDNAALYRALKASGRVYCVFVFDTGILGTLPSRHDRRVEFIRESVVELNAELENIGGGLAVLHGQPEKLIPELAAKLGVDAVFVNHDYEPLAVARDAAVADALKASGIAFHGYKDQVIFEKDEVLTGAGKFFSVFTPYKNAWLRKLDSFYLQSYAVRKYSRALKPAPEAKAPR